MKKEKVFIVLSHMNQPRRGSHPGRGKDAKVEWDVVENVEFVNQIRNRHISTGSVIADYINRKIISGSRFGMTEYPVFDTYIRKKYVKQMAELDAMYSKDQIQEEEIEQQEVFVDKFGNVREKTVFDL